MLNINLIDQCDHKSFQVILNILSECDNDFVPPLSLRDSTTSPLLSTTYMGQNNVVGPVKYFEGLKTQYNLMATINGVGIGFMSFINNYECLELRGYTPSNHVTTVCITKSCRGNGICLKLYQFLLNQLPDLLKAPNISTRTWSTNLKHLNILKNLNFNEVDKLENHRGPGIHTVYYALRAE